MNDEMMMQGAPDPEFHEALRRLIYEERMSSKELAAELGVDPSTVSRWLNKETAPSPEARRRLFDLLERRQQKKREWYRPLVSKRLATLTKLPTDQVKEVAERILDDVLNNPPKINTVRGDRHDPDTHGHPGRQPPRDPAPTHFRKLLSLLFKR